MDLEEAILLFKLTIIFILITSVNEIYALVVA